MRRAVAGLALKLMREPQQAAAYKLLSSVLSPVGAAKAQAIMTLETVLAGSRVAASTSATR